MLVLLRAHTGVRPYTFLTITTKINYQLSIIHYQFIKKALQRRSEATSESPKYDVSQHH